MSTWVKICKYLDFCKNFLKISIFIKIFENIACGENCSKIWNLVKNFEKSWFWSKFTKMSILVITEENIDFSRNLQKYWFWGKKLKISILVKIWGNFDFGQYSWKSRLCSKLTIISIFVNILENIDNSGDCRKISNLVKFVEKSRFWTKLSKILDFGKNLPKCRFWSKDKMILILVKTFKKT